ncbi:hypothetical protein BDW72DRAFT_213663 [Aspergillus terricola var. indicus]
MASNSFLSLKVSDLEILSYENAETWFTKMQAGLDPLPDINEDDDFFLPPRASLSPAPRRTIPTLTLEPLIETSATTEVEKI